MSTLVITTFSEDGYYLYGKRLIETWCQYWPTTGYTLRIYAEHDLTVNDPRVEVINLNDVSPKMIKFKEDCIEMASKETAKKIKNKILKTVKWCHKVYAMDHALRDDHDYLIFLDGDTYTINNVAIGALEALSAQCLFSVHFERIYNRPHYETGLVIFNKQHSQIEDLKEHLTSAYDTKEIFKLHKSWDGFWFAELHERRGYKVNDLANGRFRGVFSNPAVKSILVHEAGNDKYEGKGFNTFSGRKIVPQN